MPTTDESDDDNYVVLSEIDESSDTERANNASDDRDAAHIIKNNGDEDDKATVAAATEAATEARSSGALPSVTAADIAAKIHQAALDHQHHDSSTSGDGDGTDGAITATTNDDMNEDTTPALPTQLPPKRSVSSESNESLRASSKPTAPLPTLSFVLFGSPEQQRKEEQEARQRKQTELEQQQLEEKESSANTTSSSSSEDGDGGTKKKVDSTETFYKSPHKEDDHDDNNQHAVISSENDPQQPQKQEEADSKKTKPASTTTATSIEDDQNYRIDLTVLRRVASQGIDEDSAGGSLRAVTWRVLLGYLPPDRREWHAATKRDRQAYHTFVQELFCVEEDDMAGRLLRGYRSRTNKKKSKAERKERRRVTRQNSTPQERLEQRRKERERLARESSNASNYSESAKSEPATSSLRNDTEKEQEDPPCLVVVPSDDDDNDNNEDAATQTPTDADTAAAPISPDGSTREPKDACTKRTTSTKLSPKELLNQDPSIWNMSVREQKILERLTNTDAVNQLLVKQHCREWNNFLENAKLLDEIRKDVNRTHPQLYFFLDPHKKVGAKRYAALERILFVWAKLNKGVRYVQGMNEIVGTLYYVLANDLDGEWADEAEADTYVLFNILMSEMRDIFVADLDNAETGIVGRINNMQNLLQLHDPGVKKHLDEIGVDASYFAVRWLTTLLSREFLLPDTIRLWDSMFASTHKENFLRYVCVTMVLTIRDRLLRGDFATCLKLLQSYPTTNIDSLLDCGRALWIYEMQVTMAIHKGKISMHQALHAIPPPDNLIMAFGLRGGVALTKREKIQITTAKAKESAAKATTTAKESVQNVAAAGQGFFGGARRFFREIRQDGIKGARGRLQQNSSFASSDGVTEEAPPASPVRKSTWDGADLAAELRAAESTKGDGVDDSLSI